MKTIAIIGCGAIARSSHFPVLAKIEGVRVKYACDLVESKAAAMKEKYPQMVENVITDYHIALADPEVQAVYVLTQNYMHYTVTMDALKAGKHVFCEKPITVNYPLSKEMADEAKKQGKLLNIGVCNRYRSSVELIEEAVREGKLGNIYHVYCSFRAFRSIPALGGPFTDKAQSGGGVLIDWGVHFLDLILYILGGAELKTATCDSYSEMAKDMKSYRFKGEMYGSENADIENGINNVEDFITGHIRTDKCSISFNGAWAQNIAQEDMYIDFLGDKGGIRLDYGKQFTYTDGTTLESVRSTNELNNSYLTEDIAFLNAIETGAIERSYIDKVLPTARLMDALYESAKTHREVQL